MEVSKTNLISDSEMKEITKNAFNCKGGTHQGKVSINVDGQIYVRLKEEKAYQLVS